MANTELASAHPLFTNLQLLKLGGSLITDKTQPHTVRLDVIQRLASEIAQARQQDSRLSLVIGHGSGSYGHVPARKYGTRDGVNSPAGWLGFVEVWREAQSLNRLVMDALAGAGLPVIAFSPLASLTARDGMAARWELEPLRRALQAGLIPVVYGDVIFDTVRGGTILSTEGLFIYLTGELGPRRILLAGSEPGVWADYPACTSLVAEITPGNYAEFSQTLTGSAAPDVTGGMASKIHLCLELARAYPALEMVVFSGEIPGTLLQVCLGATAGTRICAG
jgi:isopentenyl phosphate kinase